ncbi:MAG: hypothetical protein LKI24_04035 [Acidipropionibacterium sp.]|jgi:hypothetical protein|nr:hypothetical protein [Acidipropionibacterium sp.]
MAIVAHTHPLVIGVDTHARAYVERRTAEGCTLRGIRRCLNTTARAQLTT